MNPFIKTFAVVSFAVAAGAPGARADILAFGSYPNAIFVTDTYKAVPLRQNGSTTLTFTTTEPDTLVAVTYKRTMHPVLSNPTRTTAASAQ
jgi:hypothetical protein